jgi:hypothetical protein
MFLMNMCNHQINLLANIFCSEAFPAKCKLCGCKVIRKHNTSASLLAGFFAFGGVLLLLLLIVFIDYSGFILLGIVSLTAMIYFIGINKVPLIEYSQEAQAIYKQRSKKQLRNLAIFITLIIIVAISET